MATAKTGIKKSGPTVQGDTDLRRMWMGQGWRTRAMRRSAEGRGASGGRATRKAQVPPPGGWRPEHFK